MRGVPGEGWDGLLRKAVRVASEREGDPSTDLRKVRGFAMVMSRERIFRGEGNSLCKGPGAGFSSRGSQWLQRSEGGMLAVLVGGGQRGQLQVTHPLVGHGEDSDCFSE